MRKSLAAWLLLPLALVAGDCDSDDDDGFFFLPRAALGDLNVDGFADLAIGAPLHDGGGLPGAQRGAVFVHFGGPAGPSAAPDLTLFGQEDGAQFGASLAFAGDVNGRGAPDLLVGAPFDDADGDDADAGSDRGRAFVFFGGPAMDAAPDVTISGSEPDALLGWSVAWATDTNFDGFDDWLVGAPLDDADGDPASDSGLDRGRAFFFFGSFATDGSPDLVLAGREDGAEFGTAVAAAGDLNAGGAGDLAVGAPLDDGDDVDSDAGDDRGRVFVFFGGSILDAAPDLVFTGDEAGARFGSDVAGVFDVNGDGIHDLLVGAPLHDAGGGLGADRGRAHVFFGAGAPDTVADVTLSGATDDGAFGQAVARAGDVDGDGARDFLVGAPLEDPGARVDAGRAYLFRGGAGIDAVADLVLEGIEAGGRFGAALAGPGDVNGGGRDLVVGAPLDDADGNASDDALERGRTLLFSGGAGVLDAAPDAALNGPQDDGQAGSAIAR